MALLEIFHRFGTHLNAKVSAHSEKFDFNAKNTLMLENDEIYVFECH
jgi:hypothetical protein